MNIKLRQEATTDLPAISEVIIDAYSNISYSNHKEQHMVERLRASDAFIPELSIVAELPTGKLAGHVLLTRIGIAVNEKIYPALALAPLSVKRKYQNIGVGSKLVIESHRVSEQLGYNYIVILGIPDYYQQFGYEYTSKYNIKVPIKISESNCLITSLLNTGFSEIAGGTVKYADEFFG